MLVRHALNERESASISVPDLFLPSNGRATAGIRLSCAYDSAALSITFRLAKHKTVIDKGHQQYRRVPDGDRCGRCVEIEIDAQHGSQHKH